MSDELKFKCEICGKEFDADPDTMLECTVDVNVLDEETGEPIDLSPEELTELIADISTDDPEIAMFSRGAICMCVECQNKWIEDADECEPEEEE